MGILSPQIVSLDEVKKLKEFAKEVGGNLKVGVMVETPASVQIIEDLCKEEIEFISFGTNDLTQYTLAIDRGNEEVQYLHDEMHPAILNQLSHVIRICKKYGVETSICGQAGSRRDMAEFLVKEGIDSISVNADKAKEISELVRDLENKDLKGSKDEKPEEKNEVKKEVVEEKQEEVKKDKYGRELFDAVCTECGQDAEVPFKPKEGKPAYCPECFKKKKQQRKQERAMEKKESIVEKKQDEEPEPVPEPEPEPSTPDPEPVEQVEKIVEKEIERELKEDSEEIQKMAESDVEKEMQEMQGQDANNEEVLDIF
jgi:CxxC-x17-CxxC domain-containing protein